MSGPSKVAGATLEELRERQRTKTRLSGAIYKVGDVLANRYKVKDIAGSGGAGVVYRTHDQDIDVDVALKVINAKLLQTTEERKLFSREIKTAKKLSHQNIVRIYDEGRDAERAFFTMQFLEGLSLRKIIDLRKEKKQHFALSEVEPIYNQLCQALDYAHKSTLHGDMKPDNVIVLPDLLKVTDFGVLRGLPRKPFLAIQKSRQPNFQYLAPEVRLEVEDLTPAADIYSLGVILAEMLTGQLLDENKPEQLSVAKTGLDTSVLKVIRRAILRAPKERYATAGELYDEIRSILSRGDVVARPPQAEGELRTSGGPPPPNEGAAVEAKASHPPMTGSEMETEAPTQRLDISKHGARPVADEAPGARNVQAPELPSGDGTGTYAAIEDDMIESTAAPGGLPVPPLADELGDDEIEGEESTEAVENMMELSASEIVLVADPRATNVIEVDLDNDHAKIKQPGNGVSLPAEQQAVPAPSVAPGPVRENVIVSLKPEGSVPDAAAFSGGAESTHAGRLDVPVAAAPAVSEPVKPKRPTPPPTSPVIRGMPAEEMARQARERDQVSVVAVPDLSEPKVIPRSPTTSMVPSANGSHGAPSVPAPANGKAKSRPMTRPRMAAIKSLPPEPSVSIFEGFPKSDTPLDPTGARPLVVTKAGIDRKPTTAKADAPPAREDRRMRPVILIGGALLMGLLALIIVLVVFVMRTNEALREQERMMSELRTSAVQARQVAEAATDERQQIESAQKSADDSATAAKKAAEEAAAVKLRAQEDADRLAREQRAGEAEAKRREADEADKKRLSELARAEAEEKKKSDLESRRKDAAEREARAQAAAEDRERRLREREDNAAAKKAAAEEAALKRAEAAEAASAKRKEDEERRRAEAEEKKAADAEAAKAAAAVAAVPPGKACPRGMAMIDAGSFMMGAPRNDPERNFGDKTYASTEVSTFCIDYYEAPNGRGREPITKVSWSTADKACKAKGKRLCQEEEWEKACKGPSGLRYPYGNQWDPALCATEDDEGNDRQISKSGTFEKCRSGYTVLDLSGNVAEWTATAWDGGGGYVVKGGSADRPGYDGRCAARKKKASNSSADTMGYRCCADPK